MRGMRCWCFLWLQLAVLLAVGWVAKADVPEDLVDQIPGFPRAPFAVYSGLLHVPGPLGGHHAYDKLEIHYQFHASQRDPKSDPLLVWHQGGPGGTAISGLYMEMGYFQVSADGLFTNPYAWNRVANMLYLESPAGAGWDTGYSACIKDGKVCECFWDDVTQAEAYAHTLESFFKAFPEYGKHDIFLAGESYFGTSGPNIAHWIVNSGSFNATLGRRLKGIALGNACWGVECCGPNFQRNEVEFYYGKGLFSEDLHGAIYAKCNFPDVSSADCKQLLSQMRREVGPHDVENVYNNCPATEDLLTRTNKDMGWLLRYLRAGAHKPVATHAELKALNGGYDWVCGGLPAFGKWIIQPDVRKALHMDHVAPGRSKITYNISGPMSIELYPELVRRVPHIMVYNGIADPSVPFQGDEEWIGDLVKQGVLEVARPWEPWRSPSNSTSPCFETSDGPVAGSVTSYNVLGVPGKHFSYVTVRLAGHVVPTFRPQAALQLISDFLDVGCRHETKAQKSLNHGIFI